MQIISELKKRVCDRKKIEKYEINNKEKIPYKPIYPILTFKLDCWRINFENNKP